jgi:purine-nucleoside phosphorylase
VECSDSDQPDGCQIPETSARCAEQIAQAVRGRWSLQPSTGLILGTGLGRLARQIDVHESFDYADLPHLPRSTAIGHRGRLVCGTLGGVAMVAMEGRCHFYEGYSMQQLTLPVIAMAALGIKTLVLSNASGGLNPRFQSGDVMVIEDHINLMFWRQGIGRPAGPCRSARRIIYDRGLIEKALRIARRNRFGAFPGVYVAVTGPNYETRAEYRFLRRIGGDAVGMSTVPEAQAAACCGLRTLGLSIITNVARPDSPHVVRPEDVIAAAESAEQKVRTLILDLLSTQSATAIRRFPAAS